jgi:hypothetical protein
VIQEISVCGDEFDWRGARKIVSYFQ